MVTVRYLVGDVFERMAELEDGSIDLILTSPPFLALRSYLPADHPDKAKEIGSEKTPAEFVDVLLRLSAEWRRLLTPYGSLVVELGDTYSGSGGAGGDYTDTGLRAGQQKFAGSAIQHRRSALRNRAGGKEGGQGWPLAKSLALVPEAYRFALAYGINPHTGQPSPAGQWRIRNVVRWVRPNPPVGALGDKFRPATSELVVATVAKDRWFDLDAVRTPHKADPQSYSGNGYMKGHPEGLSGHESMPGNPVGAPPLDWWKISPKGYTGAHYAVWPPELLIKPIKAMCPEKVCAVCGEPSRRIAETVNAVGKTVGRTAWTNDQDTVDLHHSGVIEINANDRAVPDRAERRTLGWSDCGHDAWRPGVVLDPFAGTGTTGLVANGHGRNAIMIDIDQRNFDLARDRIGPLIFDASNPP